MIQRLIKLSRPRFWTYLAGPFLIGYVFVAYPKDLYAFDFWYGLFYFLIPANIFLYGVNDLFDRDTDHMSQKKKGRELVATTENVTLYKNAVVISLIFSVPFFFSLTSLSKLLFILFLGLSYMYSAPPFRLKARPVLDFASNILYLIPGIIGFTELTGFLPAWQLFIGLSLWPMAMHLFSAIPDIESDHASGIRTTAVFLGKTRSLILTALFWSGTAYVTSNIVGPPFIILAWVYPIIPLLILFGFGKIEKVYWFFPMINGIIGFILFLYSIDANITF